MTQNFFYMVEPMYGGWVTFTAHLLLKDFIGVKRSYGLFKIKPRLENKTRPFAFNLRHQNITTDAIRILDNPVIIALDEKHEKYLPHFQEPTLFIHAMNEPKKRLVDFYKSCKDVITIRSTIQDKLLDMGVDAKLADIPFYQYPLTVQSKEKTKAISMARVEFRKRQDLICMANMQLAKEKHPIIEIYGQANGIYTFHKLKNLQFEKWYKGKYAQDFTAHQELLSDAKYLVNLTQVPNDGGNLEYTILQAIYQDVGIVLHRDWVDAQDSKWNENYNCFAISDEKELAELMKINPDTSKICRNAKKLLEPHIKSHWV